MTDVHTGCGTISLEAPDWRVFDLPKIARWLAEKLRFNGHLARPVSVGEHSLVVAGLVRPHHRLAALLHDAHEYGIGDILRPVEAKLPRNVRWTIHLWRLSLDLAVAQAALVAAGSADVGGVAKMNWSLANMMRDAAVRAADDAACAFELRYCGPRSGDWPERALYPRCPPAADAVAARWLSEVDAAARAYLGTAS